jgi:predicted transcriptional regulator of viral defense system
MTEKRIKDIEALSPTEQMVYSLSFPKRIVSTSDVKEILGDSHKSVDYITNLRQKGYFQKVRKGLYTVVPPNLVGKEVKPDKFLVGNKVKEDYYFSYHSALELHGLAQSAYNTVWITTSIQQSSFSYQSISYKFVTTKYFFGLEEMNYSGVKINVTDREKTFLDCIRRIKYAGGLEELMKSLNTVPTLNWYKFIRYLEKFREKALYQKSGFILEKLDLSVPDRVLDELKKSVGKKTYYLDKKKNSSFVSRWNLMVPESFEELIYGS